MRVLSAYMLFTMDMIKIQEQSFFLKVSLTFKCITIFVSGNNPDKKRKSSL